MSSLRHVSNASNHVIAVSNRRDAASPPRNSEELPRSASYTYIGHAKSQAYANSEDLISIKQALIDSDLTPSADHIVDITPPDSSGWNTPEEHVLEQRLPVDQARELIAKLQKSQDGELQGIAVSTEYGRDRAASSATQYRPRNDSTSTVSTVASSAPTTPRPPASANFSRKINRHSWIGIASTPSTPSRSPSPPKKDGDSEGVKSRADSAITPDPSPPKRSKSFLKRRQSWIPSKEKKSEKDASTSVEDQADQPRKSLTLRGKSARPNSSLFRSKTYDENEAPARPKTARPAVPALPKSFSTDRLPSLRTDQIPAAPVPRLLSTKRTPTNPLPQRKKDELWNVFRSLDGDYTKFSSKSVAFKANVVRSSLLPFLRNYATHPSNLTLRPEDLDRRSNILNKWWTGMIEMLHGRNNQSISGTDRPAILDGISGIMERSEWRLPPSPFSPLNQRMTATSSLYNRSATSLASSQSDFLTESVHHNVRNIFVQNLSSQMAFVVDKMSLRNASASLVTFCGKACAYAFMFVPGMADVLVRLWDLQMDNIRRVLDGNGVNKFDNLTELADHIMSGFPPALQQLGFSSLMKYMRKLRTSPPLPLGTTNIQWWGHWLDRWTGRESDLFYVFVKYFHILTTDFLPSDSTKRERMCAPGLPLVHAQILTNLEATIHRDPSQPQQAPTAVGASPTFDDVFGDPDAIVTALPLPPINAVRLMSENRMIMLIRDFLSERAADHPIARQVFAESFNTLLQTATRGTSMFDHAACYTLLDFLEEALVLLVRFEHLADSEDNLIDHDFWTTVWKKMMHSQNTMTEIRLYSFLYTVWNTVICDLGKKTEICADFLLEPEIFASRFNHWCPMVRSYYMRLLCWRVGRYDGETSEYDLPILETLLDRLQTSWSYYVFLREQADQQRALLPPTNPSCPAPNRRLLIVRTDPQVNPGNAFLSFDGIVSPKSPTEPTSLAAKRSSTISQVTAIDTRPDTALSTSDSEPETRGRGLSGFIKKLMTPSSRSKSQGTSRSKNRLDSKSPGPDPGLARAATAEPPQPIEETKPEQPVHPPPVNQRRNFSFKFSLEYQPNMKPLPTMRLLPPRLPLPAHQLLQARSHIANTSEPIRAIEPIGDSKAHARYCGRALAEWMVVLSECQSFFERRKNEGVPSNKLVETPTLAVEVFRRPG